MQPSMEACVWIHQAQDGLVEAVCDVYSRCGHAYLTVACVLPLAGFLRWRLQSPEGPLYQGSATLQPKMPGCQENQVFPRQAATISQARWRAGNNFRGGATNRNLSREDHGRLLLLPLQDLLQAARKCRRRRGLGRSSKDLNRRSCPDYPARRGD